MYNHLIDIDIVIQDNGNYFTTPQNNCDSQKKESLQHCTIESWDGSVYRVI